MAYTRRTLAELDRRLHERLDGHAYFTKQDRYDALRLALLIWQAGTGTWRGAQPITAIERDWLVPTPGVVQVLSVVLGDFPLLPTTIPELSHLRPNWRREICGEGAWPSRPYYWAPVGPTTVALWPTPATTMYGVATGLTITPVEALATQGATIDLPDTWMDAVLSLAVWWCAGKATTAEQDKYQADLDRLLPAFTQAQGSRAVQQAFRAFQLQLAARHPLPASTAAPTEEA